MKWENQLNFIHKSSMLVFLFSYLESSLNEIANWFCEYRQISIGKIEKKMSKIIFYVTRIGECCKCDLYKNLSAEMKYLKKIKKIRNQLVHEEWDQVHRFDDQFYLCDVFHTIANIFKKIEKAACNAGIVEEWDPNKFRSLSNKK